MSRRRKVQESSEDKARGLSRLAADIFIKTGHHPTLQVMDRRWHEFGPPREPPRWGWTCSLDGGLEESPWLVECGSWEATPEAALQATLDAIDHRWRTQREWMREEAERRTFTPPKKDGS